MEGVGRRGGMLIYMAASAVDLRNLEEGTDVPANSKTLIEKIEALPAERIAEIEDFVDFIRLREQEQALTRAAAAATAPALAESGAIPRDATSNPHEIGPLNPTQQGNPEQAAKGE